jgi:fructose-bisphosphate aldolase class 1
VGVVAPGAKRNGPKRNSERYNKNTTQGGLARTRVADGKGSLASDETIPTLTRRFDTLKSTERSRRSYREMLWRDD